MSDNFAVSDEYIQKFPDQEGVRHPIEDHLERVSQAVSGDHELILVLLLDLREGYKEYGFMLRDRASGKAWWTKVYYADEMFGLVDDPAEYIKQFLDISFDSIKDSPR